ncbi:MAG: Prevent-host-death protein [Tardiphaga sp.]|jgi:antitoxin (DNA-binding transcriptional repressor) of toxin-antitoxin stability system|nr:Prevent-host-death protein [Tardiphaga sp.]
MKHVSLAEARANIAELLETVERGEAVQINPDNSTANPVTFDAERIERGRQAMRELRELRKTSGKATTEEILAWRDEGRRF